MTEEKDALLFKRERGVERETHTRMEKESMRRRRRRRRRRKEKEKEREECGGGIRFFCLVLALLGLCFCVK